MNVRKIRPTSIEQREGRGIRQGNKNDEVAIYRYVTKQTFDAYNWSLVENKQRFISQVMTSKAVSRSCEDIDEATLSYAEIKAVATGNPLIREKMEVDNDVQRLKLLKASYDNQRYGLQDNFMIKYPKLIKTATEKLANVREDIKARDKELIDNPDFAITIGNATYTERVDGGTVMLEAISKCKTGETTPVGKFHGFELLVEKNFLSINYMVLRGKTEYKAELSTSPVGSMVKLENLFNGLHENVDFLEKKIEQYQNDLEASKAEYDKPFAYSAELEEKLARQYELNAQLDLENASVNRLQSHFSARATNKYIPNYKYIKNAIYPANENNTCGYTAACLILNYWHKVKGNVIDSSFLDSNGNLKTTGNTLQDKLLSYGKSNSSWGLTIRDVLIDYCNEYGVAATSTYYVTNFDIFAEVGRNRPVIVFGYFPDSPGQVQSRGKVFHAVTAYGTSTSGLVTKLIVHYGWSGYSHVTLDGGLVGSSTQFVLN